MQGADSSHHIADVAAGLVDPGGSAHRRRSHRHLGSGIRARRARGHPDHQDREWQRNRPECSGGAGSDFPRPQPRPPSQHDQWGHHLIHDLDLRGGLHDGGGLHHSAVYPDGGWRRGADPASQTEGDALRRPDPCRLAPGQCHRTTIGRPCANRRGGEPRIPHRRTRRQGTETCLGRRDCAGPHQGLAPGRGPGVAQLAPPARRIVLHPAQPQLPTAAGHGGSSRPALPGRHLVWRALRHQGRRLSARPLHENLRPGARPFRSGPPLQ